MSIEEKAVGVPEGQPGNRYIALTSWNKFHEWPPRGGLRHLVFYEKTNGFDKVVVRAGKRILIDEAAFFKWLRSNKKEVK